jgi:phage gp36-like protein
MAYATVDDMVLRFGQAEMIRATTPDGAEAVAVVPEAIEVALTDASELIDSYLRKRYRVPLATAPAAINRACCMLARYDLGMGGERSIAEQVKDDRAETITWLARISRGEVVLGMEEVTAGDESFATASGRPDVLGGHGGSGGRDGFGFWGGDS